MRPRDRHSEVQEYLRRSTGSVRWDAAGYTNKAQGCKSLLLVAAHQPFKYEVKVGRLRRIMPGCTTTTAAADINPSFEK
jgi:hypothetical protein